MSRTRIIIEQNTPRDQRIPVQGGRMFLAFSKQGQSYRMVEYNKDGMILDVRENTAEQIAKFADELHGLLIKFTY